MHNSILEIKNLSIGYQNTLVKNINISLHAGEICLLMGNNGQGKTTLIKTLLGQLKPKSGDILLKGKKISQFSIKEIAKEIAIVFSKAPIPQNYTVTDLISLGKYVHYPYYFSLSEKDQQEVDEIIQNLHLGELRHRKLSELSDGNLQKAYIGRALAQNTSIIILDEPTTHLDEGNRKKLLSLLQKIAKTENKAILFSSHDIYGASEIADCIWKINFGELISGMAEDILYQHLSQQPVRQETSQLLPQISAPHLEAHLLKNAILKNTTEDYSKFHIYFKANSWIVDFNQKKHTFSKISDLINSLKNLG
ncbi:ABC transporter ATP-binding protein [Elizabethkingia sp. JS20170427COW]|uniref:ABC transporter ATP-binding protein n=1 Tax=Elizabethkingia sp. JS20170427COW TaxID=2583851 RepID=UPI001110E2DA|nr:ABC transporter ATP-binding protein [Elizabethkingia sp. JS20170427COW]QCX52363.1 ABC transporter ATP-binding protein [Elizabethkingia sp. JS20170427COW]